MLEAVRNTFFPFKEMPSDLSDCGIEGDPERPWLKEIVEPLAGDAPMSASPHCCYLNTVIFYEKPYRVVEGTRNLATYAEVRHRIACDDILKIDGEEFSIGCGRVEWRGSRWVMVHPARRCPPITEGIGQ